MTLPLTVLAAMLGCASDDGARDPGGDAGNWQDEDRGAGASLGTFQFTYYWVAAEDDYTGSLNTSVYNMSCTKIATVRSKFWSALKLEGTGKTTSGQLLNYAGSCGCARSPCFKQLGADKPWGEGVQGRALDPFRSIAVDKDVIPYGSWMYIPELDGATMPGDAPVGGWVHDGCVLAADTGSAINNKHIDFFAAKKEYYTALINELGLESVTVRQGGTACTGEVPDGGDGDGGGDGGDDGGGDDGGNDGSQVCFPGADNSGSTCLPLVFPGEPTGYNYPNPLNSNYRQPIAYLDLQAIDGATKIAPNFALNEIAQLVKGRYAVVQPHAIVRMQQLRTQLGALKVNSGYRSPSYNSGVGGANSSRHMFGDGFDFSGVSAGLTTVENACQANSGFLVEYTSHVHCDWRGTNVDPLFYGAVAVQPDELDLRIADFSGELVEEGGVWYAPAQGFDEGEPQRRWTARDAAGEIIVEAIGESFVAPAGTARIEVLVGAVVKLATDLD